MTITNPSPTRAPFDQERVRSKAVLSIDWTRGVATAITGQGATVTRAGNAFVTAGNGVLTPIGTNRPRLLHFVGANRGLLTEGAGTNLQLRSEEFGNAHYTPTRASVTADVAIAPNGSLTADKLVENTDNNTHFLVSANVALGGSVDSAPYTVGVFAKAAGRNRIRLVDGNQAGAGNGSSIFDLGAGTVVSGPGTIQALGNGWFRCSILCARNAGTNAQIQIRLVSTGTTESYAGDGTSGVFLWGSQIELGPNASTYTPTVAATVTRPTDQVSYDNFPQPAEIAARGGITVYHRFVEQGTINTTSAIAARVGVGAQADANRLWEVFEDGGNARYRLTLRNGTTNVTATWGGANPVRGDLVEHVWQWENVSATTARVRLGQAINGGTFAFTAFTSALDVTALLASGWATAPTLYVGARDAGDNPGFQLNQAFKARFGIHDIASMRTLV